MSEPNVPMTLEERHALVEAYLGKTVEVEIDRPVGYVHHKKDRTLVYPINYGYVAGVLGGDGEELDVYVLGYDTPQTHVSCRVVGIAYRADDVEDKLIAAPEGMTPTAEDMAKAIQFQEKYYRTTVRALKE